MSIYVYNKLVVYTKDLTPKYFFCLLRLHKKSLRSALMGVTLAKLKVIEKLNFDNKISEM